ncbi:hypothetical protein GYM75_11555 [Gilliamella sp. ESL0441]|uniref:GapS6b family protein n=1 Tax=Gilliamella sp. ESL0441 TaxID=2704654 RepID=UPI001C6A7218|nr:hypothetical protein [Gilliamella sp. ESL0441]QYN45424.1 hypothetical protein GYM75_11555 [Gilliamella sp. ESL0441]
MNKNESSIPHQIHKGSGDNVYGNKYVNNISTNNLFIYADIVPENLRKIVLDILNDLRDYKADEAKIKLTVLKSFNNIDEESSAIIETLSIHSNLIEKENLENALFVINTYLTKYENSLIKDLCLSALIELLHKQNKHHEALERYKHESKPGEFAKKSYFYFLADSEELETIFNFEKFSLTEHELEGIVCGALRHNKGDIAYAVADFLNLNFNSYNSKFLLLFARAVKLNPIISVVHYWLCTSEQRNEILDISNQIIHLFEESGCKDYRIFNIATPIIHYIRGDHDGLLSLCRKYKNEVEKVDEFVAQCIDKNVVTRSSDTSEIDFNKVFDDDNYQKEVLDNVLRKNQISPKEVFLLSRVASPQQIRNWLKEYGQFATEDKIESDFNSFYLEILSVLNNKDFKQIRKIQSVFYTFINKYSEIINELNPEYILEMAERLLNIDLAYEASKLLKFLIISHDDFWNSWLIYIYINSLYKGQQYLQLSQFLDKVQKETWNSDIYIIKSAITSFVGNFIEAEKIIKEGLNFNRLSLTSWECLVHLNIKLKKNKIECVLNDIPEELFNEPSRVGTRLLILMANNNLFNKAEKIIVSWFIQSPNRTTATYLTDFSFSINDVEFGSKVNTEILVSDKIINCLGGITYKSDDKVITKLIVENPKVNHEMILNASSPIAKFLNELSIGERRSYSMNVIEILERTSPYTTAVNLAIKLRERLNDGNDCFYSFKLPEDPDQIIQFFEEKCAFDKDFQKNKNFKNPSFPMIYKTYLMGKVHDPINAALEQFTKNIYVKHDLVEQGDELTKNVILDIYTICYLALTQLSKNLEQTGLNIKITLETKSYLENWIAKIEFSEDFRIGLDDNGILIKNTSDDIKRNFGDMINEIKHIIKIADIVYLELIDVPFELLNFQEFIDTATYTTILAAISLDLHLLCIDQIFCKFLPVLGIKIYNPKNLFSELTDSLDFQTKKFGLYLHASNCIPYVLNYNDFFLLAKSQDVFADQWLVKMLNKYPQVIDNFEGYKQFLITILSRFIVNCYFQKKFLQRNPIQEFKVNNPFSCGVDDVFYACCNNILKYPCNLASEEKLAIFLYNLIDRYKSLEPLLKWLRIAANSFISGHFMSFDEINRQISNHSKLKK